MLLSLLTRTVCTAWLLLKTICDDKHCVAWLHKLVIANKSDCKERRAVQGRVECRRGFQVRSSVMSSISYDWMRVVGGNIFKVQHLGIAAR